MTVVLILFFLYCFLAINIYFSFKYFKITAVHFFHHLMAFVAEASIILFQRPLIVYITFYKDALKIWAF